MRLRDHGKKWTSRIWTDSDWARDIVSLKSCSGGWIEIEDKGHWIKLQSNIALSSGEAEPNTAFKGISSGVW